MAAAKQAKKQSCFRMLQKRMNSLKRTARKMKHQRNAQLESEHAQQIKAIIENSPGVFTIGKLICHLAEETMISNTT